MSEVTRLPATVAFEYVAKVVHRDTSVDIHVRAEDDEGALFMEIPFSREYAAVMYDRIRALAADD